MGEVTRSASLTDDIYQQLRSALIDGRLLPGERLKTINLSQKLGVSLGVVREALSRLSAERFVLAEPQRGFRAAPLSTEELMQLGDATVALEGICLRRAIEVGTLEWEARVTAAYYRFSRTPQREERDPTRISQEFASAYGDFRRALTSACNNDWLLRLRDILYVQAERYRLVCAQRGPEDLDFCEGFEAIVEAALKRDADRAVALLGERLRTNTLRMRKALESTKLPGRPRTTPGTYRLKSSARRQRSR